jgi:hypothetical protein
MTATAEKETTGQRTPKHQWTNGGDRVLLVKCCDAQGRGRNGFQYPKSGSVKPEYCSKVADCESGGLFGWAWGINLGVDKDPDYQGIWIVLSAKPDQVILVGDKCKVAADKPEEVDCEVVYYGDALGAIMKTHTGRIAWNQHWSSGSAANSGDRGSAANSGYSGSAANSGDSGSAANSGYSGSAANSGYSGSAANSGDSGGALITGEFSTIEVSGKGSIGAAACSNWTWKVHAGAVVACRWVDDNGNVGQRLLIAEELGLLDGQIVNVKNGEIVT